MKNLITLILGLSLMGYVHGMVIYAQRGPEPSPAKVKADEHENAKDFDKDKGADKQAREARREEKEDDEIVDRIDRNPRSKARIESMLPPGMSIKTAAMGFRNEGKFVSALHVSRNLNIPFDQLKSKLTGDHSTSLGRAIRELRPNLTERQAKEEAELAEKQAKETERVITKNIS